MGMKVGDRRASAVSESGSSNWICWSRMLKASEATTAPLSCCSIPAVKQRKMHMVLQILRHLFVFVTLSGKNSTFINYSSS